MLLEEEVFSVFLEAIEEVVMVVFPDVGGNLTLDVTVGLVDIFAHQVPSASSGSTGLAQQHKPEVQTGSEQEVRPRAVSGRC